MKRWSLRARFLLLLIGLLLAVFAAITLIIVRQDSKTLRTNLVDESKSFAALATQPIGGAFVLYQNSGTIRIQQQVDSFTELDPHINQVEVVDTTGKRLFTNNPAGPIKISVEAATSLNPSYIYNKNGDLTAIIQPYVENFGIHRYAVVYGVSYDSVNQSIQSIVTFIVILSAAILLVSLAVWYLLINSLFLGPVAHVSQLALKISRGDLNQPIRLKRKDEIGDLAAAVDTMANSLKDDIVKLKQLDTMKNEFMMITSHNLLTPLTIIKGYLETIKSVAMPDDVKEVIEPISVNVNRLDGFAEDVLTISTLEAGQNVLNPQPIEMAPLLKTISDEFSIMAKQKKLVFESAISTSAKVNLSKPHFRSALWNLLDNAYKFTPEGGSINLAARDDGAGQLEISVKDTGSGIAAAEIPHLFTKFHRATDTLKYNYEGTGIGLYIAKLITEQHGGTITVQSTEGTGTTFTITLPTLADQPAEI